MPKYIVLACVVCIAWQHEHQETVEERYRRRDATYILGTAQF